MDNVKNDNYYLTKILSDLEFLIEHTKGKTQSEIENNPVLVDSIMFRLIQIAESSDKLSPSLKNTNDDLHWREIKGMRNRIVHDYGVIDMSVIYDTVSIDIPKMYMTLKELL